MKTGSNVVRSELYRRARIAARPWLTTAIALSLASVAGLAQTPQVPTRPGSAGGPDTSTTPQPTPQPERATQEEPAPPTTPPVDTNAPSETPAVVDVMSMKGFLVNEVAIQMMTEHPNLPTQDQLLQAEVVLIETPDGFAPPPAGVQGKVIKLADFGKLPNPRFNEWAFPAMSNAIVKQAKKLGFRVGFYVVPDPSELTIVDGHVVDKRPEGTGKVTMQITAGLVTDVRTVGIGERVSPDTAVNNSIHTRIRRHSPIQPPVEGSATRLDLLRSDSVDDYAFYLSRQPGRRVDSAIYPTGTSPGAVTLDYLITENKPWLVFGQVSNTGTRSTSRIREHFGFQQNNLTNNDDVLQIGYHTANFDDAHTLYGSYEAPIGDLDRWRWRVNAAWYQYNASEVGFSDADFEGDGWNIGADAIWNFYQDRDLFLDAIFGVDVRHVSVDNNLAGISGDETYVAPHARLRLERHRETSRTDAEVGIEVNASPLDDGAELDALGRSGADGSWVLFKGRASHSFFLEPIVAGSLQDAAHLANELYFSVEMQHALGARLIPNETMVAGGMYSVRGYPESITAGDTAIIGTAEYRWYFARQLPPEAQTRELWGDPFRYAPQYKFGPTDWDLIFRGFLDVGRVINSDRRSFEADQTLVGAGVGVEVALRRNLSFRGDFGVALNTLDDAAGNEIENSGHNEFHFVVTVLY